MVEINEVKDEEAKDVRWLNFAPVADAEMFYVGSRYTLCEVLREIYRSTNDPAIKLKCRMAITMAKLMANRISVYEGDRWGKAQYPWNPNKKHQRAKAKWDVSPEERGKWQVVSPVVPKEKKVRLSTKLKRDQEKIHID